MPRFRQIIENTFPMAVAWQLNSIYHRLQDRPDVTRHRFPVNPYKIVWVSPSVIEYATPRGSESWKTWRRDLGRIMAGDWDIPKRGLARERIEDRRIFVELKSHFGDGVPWNETSYIQVARTCRTFRSEEDIQSRMAKLDILFHTIKASGYKSQYSLMAEGVKERHFLDSLRNEILVDVDRDGRLLFVDGTHRLAIAKVLNLPQVPVLPLIRHAQWMDNPNRFLKGSQRETMRPLAQPSPEGIANEPQPLVRSSAPGTHGTGGGRFL